MNGARLKRPPYVRAIGKHLRDVPWAEREALLDDVSTHLGDAGLARDDLALWTERFGAPAEYAHQLRADLGLATDPVSLHRARHRQLRHARLRTKLTAAFAALAAGAVVATVVWAHRVEPLAFGDITAQYGATSLSAGGAGEYRWRWSRGRQFAIGSWLRNDAAVPVRVTAFKLPTINVPWDNWRVTLGTDLDHVGRRDRRFAPFSLAPGERQLVWFRGNFDRCPKNFIPGSSSGISDIATTFEVLGITRQEKVSLGFTYRVEIKHDCSAQT